MRESDSVISFRVPTEEYTAIQAAAKVAGVPMSHYIRQAIKKAGLVRCKHCGKQLSLMEIWLCPEDTYPAIVGSGVMMSDHWHEPE